MSRRPHLSDLAPEELEALALQYAQIISIEIHATCDILREKYHPVTLAKRHPFVAVGLAVAAGSVLALYLRATPPVSSGQKATGLKGFGLLRTGIAAASRLLPELVAFWACNWGRKAFVSQIHRQTSGNDGYEGRPVNE